MKIKALVAAAALACVGVAHAQNVWTGEVQSLTNATNDGTGLPTLLIEAGQDVTVSADAFDYWFAGGNVVGPVLSPGWVNATGAVNTTFTSLPGDETGITPPGSPVNTPSVALIGSGNPAFPGTLPVGTLVAQLGSDVYYLDNPAAPSVTFKAMSTGVLSLWMWDDYTVDNSSSIIATVTAVPEPSTYALMAAALGVVGLMARRRRETGKSA